MTKSELIKLVAESYSASNVLAMWDFTNDCPKAGQITDPLGLIILKAASQAYDKDLSDKQLIYRVQDKLSDLRADIIATELDILKTADTIGII